MFVFLLDNVQNLSLCSSSPELAVQGGGNGPSTLEMQLLSRSDFFKMAFCSCFGWRQRREKFPGSSLCYGYPRIPACMLINSVMSPVFLVLSFFDLCPLLSCCFCSSRFTASFLLHPSLHPPLSLLPSPSLSSCHMAQTGLRWVASLTSAFWLQ